jgi:extradiol dioxygenase family protein
MNIFHLAIPCRNLDEAVTFYANRLRCRLARRYDDRVTFDFFGHQVVCHLAPDKIDPDPEMYPRHFGMTLGLLADYESLLRQARESGVEFFAQPFHRFEGQREEHHTFLLRDPSNNLLEFKHYPDPEMMF